MGTIKIIKGDITQAEVDAIVNAANSRMLGGGGVDGAIHRAAGPKLLAACREVPEKDGMRCPAGEARLTAAGDLKAQFVIHTVGPRYGLDPKPERLLSSAYENSLDLALANGCNSIAFPAISCGVYGYPPEEAAKIAVAVCRRPAYQSLDISFYLFGEDMVTVWMAALAKER
ncbi:MAG TPA: O-acetyl-ADP-ribose deacetylase [Desulfobacteraceae bacterium]|mgnify:CR=1 FL=1|nr:O-acetyl-ADP-ribose deacetylase [Desulfobacteraceae bacterium]